MGKVHVQDDLRMFTIAELLRRKESMEEIHRITKLIISSCINSII